MFRPAEPLLGFNTLHGGQPEQGKDGAATLAGDISDLQIIAQRVGGDFGMEVRIGSPGSGSYFNPENVSITFDPLHIQKDPDSARFVAGHEGAHRAITLHPMALGLTREKVQELYSQPFFGLTHNGPEDGAVNDWLQIGFYGLKDPLEKFYGPMTSVENPTMGTPEVFAMAASLGRWPKAAQFVSEVIKDWYALRSDPAYGPFGEIRQRALEAKAEGRPGDPAVARWEKLLAEPGRFSAKLDPDVKKVLDHTIEYCRESIGTVPLACSGRAGHSVVRTTRDPKALLECGQARFSTVTDWVWPLVKELVESDLKEEAARQMLGDLQRKKSEVERKREDLEAAKQRGDGAAQKEIDRDIRRLNKELEPYESQSKEARSEIEKAIEQARRKQAEELAKQVRDAERERDESERRRAEAEKERKGLEQRSGKGAGKESLEKDLERARKTESEANAAAAAAREKVREKMEQALGSKGSQEGASGANQPGEDSAGQDPAGSKSASDPDRPDPSGAPPGGGGGRRGDLEEEISKRLEREARRGEPPPVPFDSLSERAKTALERAFEQMPSAEREKLRERARRELEELEDKLNEEMGGKLNKSKPLSHGERRRIEDAVRAQQEELARQAEQRRELDRKLQELRMSQMSDYDRGFDEVGDRINQTYDRLRRVFLREKYPKWEEGFDGGQRVNMELAMQSEADPAFLRKIWERRTLPAERDEAFEIWVDTSGSMSGAKCEETFRGAVFLAELFEKLGTKYEIHRFSDGIEMLKSFEESVKGKEIRDRFGALKSTGGGTNDAQALTAGYGRLEEVKATYKFLIVLTDAESGTQKELSRVVEKIKSDGRAVLVHFGLGTGTSDRLGLYPYSFGDLKARLSDDERRRGEKDFGDVLCEAVADMVLHPERYLRYGSTKERGDG